MGNEDARLFTPPPGELRLGRFGLRAMSDAITRHLEFRAVVQALLRDDPDHSVWRQVVSLFWRDAAFRSFDEARKGANSAQAPAASAPLLSRYIDETYFEGAAIAISRLTDPPAGPSSPGLVSLPTVLELIRAHRLRLTRELFVTFDGAPYDVGATASPDGVTDTERRHALFDRLSGKKPGKRSRSDIVHRSVPAACARRLESPAIARVRRLQNRVISHAADLGAPRRATRIGVTMADIDEAQRAILEVAETLSIVALGELLIGSPVALGRAEALAGLDAPFAPPGDGERLQEAWSGHAAARARWSLDALSEVLGR